METNPAKDLDRRPSTTPDEKSGGNSEEIPTNTSQPAGAARESHIPDDISLDQFKEDYFPEIEAADTFEKILKLRRDGPPSRDELTVRESNKWLTALKFHRIEWSRYKITEIDPDELERYVSRLDTRYGFSSSQEEVDIPYLLEVKDDPGEFERRQEELKKRYARVNAAFQTVLEWEKDFESIQKKTDTSNRNFTFIPSLFLDDRFEQRNVAIMEHFEDKEYSYYGVPIFEFVEEYEPTNELSEQEKREQFQKERLRAIDKSVPRIFDALLDAVENHGSEAERAEIEGIQCMVRGAIELYKDERSPRYIERARKGVYVIVQKYVENENSEVSWAKDVDWSSHSFAGKTLKDRRDTVHQAARELVDNQK